MDTQDREALLLALQVAPETVLGTVYYTLAALETGRYPEFQRGLAQFTTAFFTQTQTPMPFGRDLADLDLSGI